MSTSTEQIDSQTCPVCKGEKRLRGYRVSDDSFTIYPGEKQVTIICDECGGAGTVPAGPQGDLAAWHKEAVRQAAAAYDLLDDCHVKSEFGGGNNWPDGITLVDALSDHLAAMPQAQPAAPQADLAAWQAEVSVFLESALKFCGNRNKLDGNEELRTLVFYIEQRVTDANTHLAAMPQAQPDATKEPVWAELLKALKAIDEFVPDHDHEDLGSFVPDDCPFCRGRAAIAQAETGAAKHRPCAKCGGLPAEHRYLMGDGPWCACGDGGCECDGYVAEQGATR